MTPMLAYMYHIQQNDEQFLLIVISCNDSATNCNIAIVFHANYCTGHTGTAALCLILH